MTISRRLFLGGLIAGAPAVVKASSLMPIFAPKRPALFWREVDIKVDLKIVPNEDFWKWEEICADVLQAKLRALGISDLILRGGAWPTGCGAIVQREYDRLLMQQTERHQHEFRPRPDLVYRQVGAHTPSDPAGLGC